MAAFLAMVVTPFSLAAYAMSFVVLALVVVTSLASRKRARDRSPVEDEARSESRDHEAAFSIYSGGDFLGVGGLLYVG